MDQSSQQLRAPRNVGRDIEKRCDGGPVCRDVDIGGWIRRCAVERGLQLLAAEPQRGELFTKRANPLPALLPKHGAVFEGIELPFD